MFVIKIKDLLKYLVFIFIAIIFVIIFTRYFFKIFKNENIKNIYLNKSIFKSSLSSVIPDISSKEKSVNEEKKTSNKILDVELGFIKEKIEDNTVAETNINEDEIEEASTDVATQVIDSGIENKYTNTYGSVQVKNTSKYELTEEILTPDFELTDKKDIIIYHTHTCESYTSSEKYSYTPTGNFRTTDLNYSVAKVGTELTDYLKNYGYNVVHDITFHDYPTYTGSYSRSMSTIKSVLNRVPETQMIIDLHRDAIGSNSSYAPKVKIGDEYAAQLMFVLGTDGGGLEHNNWQRNLKFAIKIQQKANEMYPGLFKPIVLRNSRYNQNVSDAATIIEVGATGNTLDECLNSMKYLSKVFSETIK